MFYCCKWDTFFVFADGYAIRPTIGLLRVDKAVGNMRTAEDVCPYNKTQMISQSFCRQKATRACSRDFRKKEVKYGTI